MYFEQYSIISSLCFSGCWIFNSGILKFRNLFVFWKQCVFFWIWNLILDFGKYLLASGLNTARLLDCLINGAWFKRPAGLVSLKPVQFASCWCRFWIFAVYAAFPFDWGWQALSKVKFEVIFASSPPGQSLPGHRASFFSQPLDQGMRR